MNLHKLYLTNNACYLAGVKIKPKGIMVHSTGAKNTKLSRYVGPDDGILGENKYGNHWNVYHPGGSYNKPHAFVNADGDGKCDVCGGRQVCVHAFIGTLPDGSVATYQTLPLDMRGWHAGGVANDGYVGFEICEDDLSDPVYFEKVYKEAVEYSAYLCRELGLTEKDIICHSEGYQKRIASSSSDVMHWFPKHQKNMDTFRADVAKLLEEGNPVEAEVDGINRGRGTDELILYVGKASTGTNKWGTEVILNADLTVDAVGNYGEGNTAIPDGKMVLSGHGKKSSWLLQNAKPGRKIRLQIG